MKDSKNLEPVSVVMANYNHGHYIDEALDGLMSQTYLPNEILIIDDASTDNSKERIKVWQEKHPTVIKFYENDKNQGVLPTIRKGLGLTQNEHVLFHSADDLLLPTCLETFSRMLSEYPQAALCCSEPTFFKKDPNNRSVASVFWSDRPSYLSPDAVASKLNGGWIPGYTLIKKSLLNKCGGIIDSFKWNADWFWLLVMSFRYGLCHVPETLALNRDEEQSFLNAGLRDQKAMEVFYEHLLLELMKPEYADVLPYFSKSAALGAFGSPLAEYFLENSKTWDSKTIPLLQANLQAWNYNLALKQSERKSKIQFLKESERKVEVDPDENYFPLESLVAHAVQHCRSENYSKIVIYGSPHHTGKVLEHWQNNNGPTVVTTITDQSIETLKSQAVDAILVSAKDHEVDYINDCYKSLPGIPVISLWSPGPCNVSPPVLFGLEKIVPLIIFRLENEGPTDGICLYGAGSHSQALIDVWRKHNGPPISQVLTTDAPAKRILKGIPVRSISDTLEDDVEAIVVSSHTYEQEMATTAKKLYPNAKIISVWNN